MTEYSIRDDLPLWHGSVCGQAVNTLDSFTITAADGTSAAFKTASLRED